MLSVQSRPIDDFLGKLISRIKSQDAKKALPTVLEVSRFAGTLAAKITDPKKLTLCLNKIRSLLGNSPERARDILSEVGHFYALWELENDLKDNPHKGTIKIRKAFIRKMEKTLTAIITELSPDLARFDLAYIAGLIQLRASEKKDVAEHLKEYVKQRATKRTNPKGYASVRHFIWNVHCKVRKHDSSPTDSAICTLLADILKILTGKAKSRQNVQNILNRHLNPIVIASTE